MPSKIRGGGGERMMYGKNPYGRASSNRMGLRNTRNIGRMAYNINPNYERGIPYPHPVHPYPPKRTAT